MEGGSRDVAPGLWFAVALYAAAASADAHLTLRGLGGDLALEGNPILRMAMAGIGTTPALVLHKLTTGAATAGLAHYGHRAIERKAPWIWRIPMTPWVRRWMQRGNRAWIAFIPICALIAAQLAAVACWLALGTIG